MTSVIYFLAAYGILLLCGSPGLNAHRGLFKDSSCHNKNVSASYWINKKNPANLARSSFICGIEKKRERKRNKAVYTATFVACGLAGVVNSWAWAVMSWAGAIMIQIVV